MEVRFLGCHHQIVKYFIWGRLVVAWEQPAHFDALRSPVQHLFFSIWHVLSLTWACLLKGAAVDLLLGVFTALLPLKTLFLPKNRLQQGGVQIQHGQHMGVHGWGVIKG
jgi:hypothetical protein